MPLPRLQNKPKLPRLISVNRVLRKGAFAPSVGAADAVDVEVDVEVNELAASDVLRMPCARQIFLAVIPSADAERLTTVNDHRPTPRAYLKLPHIATVANFHTNCPLRGRTCAS